jgi:hypothetical protein
MNREAVGENNEITEQPVAEVGLGDILMAVFKKQGVYWRVHQWSSREGKGSRSGRWLLQGW